MQFSFFKKSLVIVVGVTIMLVAHQENVYAMDTATVVAPVSKVSFDRAGFIDLIKKDPLNDRLADVAYALFQFSLFAPPGSPVFHSSVMALDSICTNKAQLKSGKLRTKLLEALTYVPLRQEQIIYLCNILITGRSA